MQIDFQPNEWRNNPESRPTEQGIVLAVGTAEKEQQQWLTQAISTL